VPVVKHLGQRGSRVLQPVLDLGPLATYDGRSLESSAPLLRGQLWNAHGSTSVLIHASALVLAARVTGPGGFRSTP
jgi:hypothetical protein